MKRRKREMRMQSDQQGDGTTEDEGRDANAEAQQSKPPRQPRRRKRTVTRWPDDKITVTELTPARIPTEKRARLRMRRLIGLIARQRISLVLPSFNTLTEEDKMTLFEDCVQHWLERPNDLKATACKKIMQLVAKSWRTHKSYLTRNFIIPGLDAMVKHTYIPKGDWAAFVQLKGTEEARAASTKYKQLREQNKHDHNLGTGGYEGKAAECAQEDRV
jgi:hypothetical protein